MASYVKYQDFSEQLAKGVHQLHAAGHTVKVLLSNTAPNAATHTVRADASELSTGGGYTSGGVDTQNDLSESGGTTTVTGVSLAITASGGTIGPFRYVIAYNDSTTSPADALIGYWDYGSSITLADGEVFNIKFNNAAVGVAGTMFTLA